MTPQEAMAAYRGRDGDTRDEWMARWHSQPQCRCGDYITAHRNEPPHACRFADCSCRGFSEWTAEELAQLTTELR